MNVQELLKLAIKKIVIEAMNDKTFLEVDENKLPEVFLEVPPKKEMGDLATNFAMQTARIFRKNPRQIAQVIVDRLQLKEIDHMAIAGAGFINFYLNENVLYDQLSDAIAQGEFFGDCPKKSCDPIQVEYVSANPTGLLHVGHGRGAAFGSALVNLLRAAGYPVQSEYYINDAGNQINLLAQSVNARYLELKNLPFELKDNFYHGADIIDTAKNILALEEKENKNFLDLPEQDRLKIFQEIALQEKLMNLKNDLEKFRVTFDKWFSEKSLYPDKVENALNILKENGSIYEKDGALWLNSTKYGDDKDRVVVRDNGEPTYLASDIAYHRDKFLRGFGKVIDVWGADHHGYICRVKASLKALGMDETKLTVLLLQMVSLYRNGELVKLSKRTGQTVTLQELMEDVGVDVARYFFVMRSLDSQLDFDLDLAKKQSNENPVYYIQYAHARIASIFRQAKEENLILDGSENLTLLKEDCEKELIKKICAYPDEIELAAKELAPQKIARYVHEVAALFHSFYTQCRIIGVEKNIALARLALIGKAGQVIRHALTILGVSAPEKM